MLGTCYPRPALQTSSRRRAIEPMQFAFSYNWRLWHWTRNCPTWRAITLSAFSSWTESNLVALCLAIHYCDCRIVSPLSLSYRVNIMLAMLLLSWCYSTLTCASLSCSTTSIPTFAIWWIPALARCPGSGLYPSRDSACTELDYYLARGVS